MQGKALDEIVNIFEERAEHLSREDLSAWTAQSSRDSEIISKLKGPGAKLLSGPRGSGKSTYLRRAYFALIDECQVLTAYVNYARSLALEPLFHRNANALQIFRQWILYKIVLGLHESFSDSTLHEPHDLAGLAQHGKEFLHDLETGKSASIPQRNLSPTEMLQLLEKWTHDCGLRRCVLLLDDAAHAFSPEQQREFFEIFRSLRSRVVSAKAAVYPGITSYSPHFHVGHEAELIEAWYHPESQDYLTMMTSLAEKRLPLEMFRKFTGREEILNYLALASFGLPRGFLLMISQVLGIEEDSGGTPTRRSAEKAVSSQADSVRNIFRTLAAKLPRLKHFVEVGSELERSIAKSLREFNRNKSGRAPRATVVGISDPIDREHARVLALLEYAGILRRQASVSRGVKGTFQRFSLHHAIILVENSLSLGKAFKLGSAITALSLPHAHAFARTRVSKLLTEVQATRLTLDLAPCQQCGAERVSEDARFCMRCGSELGDASIYEELLKSPIDRLPMTKHKIAGLKQHTSIRTVQDILVDEDTQEMRKVPYVGPVWAARIRNAAEEYVSV